MRTLWCSSSASGVIVASGQTFTVSKTFAMPLDDGQNDYVLQTNGAGVGSWVAQSGGGGGGAITGTTGTFTDATDSSSSTSGPLKTAGGLAVAKSANIGGSLNVGEGLYVEQFSTFNDTATFNGDAVCQTFVARYAGNTIFQSNGGATMLQLAPISGSVNYAIIEAGASTQPAHIYTEGADTDIGLHLRAKGAGYINIEDGGDTTKRIRFGASGNTTGIITTIASSSTTSQTITLPNATTATTLAGLQMIQTFTAANTFSAVTSITNNTPSTNSSTGALKVTGGIAVTLSTEAQSSTNGGAMTIAGGLAVGAKLFVGGTAAFSGLITCATATVTGNFTFGAPISTPQAQTATGTTSAVSISTYITAITCSTAASIMTLANGTNGQTKIIQAVNFTGVGAATLTPASKTGYSTIVFSATGNTVMLCYHTTQGWMVVFNNGCTIA